jgi:hypothetical protein
MTLLQDLVASRDLLVNDGWVAHKLRDSETGARCAVGAVLDATGNEDLDAFTYGEMNERGVAAVDALYNLLPVGWKGYREASLTTKAICIADYNNGRGEQPTVKLFENAIDALAPAAVGCGVRQIGVFR